MVQQPSLPCYRRVTCGCRRWYTAICAGKKRLLDNYKPPVAKNSSRSRQRFTAVMLTVTLNRLDSTITLFVNSCFLCFFFPVYSLIHPSCSNCIIFFNLGLLTSWLTAYMKLVRSACRPEIPKTVEKVCALVLSPLSGKILPRLPKVFLAIYGKLPANTSSAKGRSHKRLSGEKN